jgi:hypothetical protein
MMASVHERMQAGGTGARVERRSRTELNVRPIDVIFKR